MPHPPQTRSVGQGASLRCRLGAGGEATATANASSTGGGTAVANAAATGGAGGTGVALPGAMGAANAISNAADRKGRVGASAVDRPWIQRTGPSTAKTSFAFVSVQSTAVAPTGGGRRRAMRSRKAALGRPSLIPARRPTLLERPSDKAYAATLIGGASHVAGALLGPRDQVFGAAIVGANYAADGGGESDAYSASSTFDFAYGGDLNSATSTIR